MRKYNVIGMSCAACSARVEKAVGSVDGVESCCVNLLTNSMTVDGTASDESIVSAVEKAGYKASLFENTESEKHIEKKDKSGSETKRIAIRLVVSVFFLLFLMYFSMGHSMLGFPVPAFLNGNHAVMGLTQLLLSTLILVINQKFFINGFKGLFHLAPNMDTLVALGSGASYIYSVVSLYGIMIADRSGNNDLAASIHHDLYFESAAMILVLITVGKMLESYSKGRTTDAIKGLMDLVPAEATVLRDGSEITIPSSYLRVGDIFIIRPGDRIPADGLVIEGSSSVDESALTGESIYVDKAVGDSVSTATINISGFLKCKAVKVGEDTTLANIVRMVGDAASSKAPIAKLADRISGIFVPVVIGIAFVTTGVWCLLGREFSFALSRGISVLVISCPCSLGLATPVAVMVGSGVGAKNGILFKTASALEEAGRIETVVLDKTGTVTVGEPRVTDVFPSPPFSDNELVSIAASLEFQSEHPLSKAIHSYAEDLKIELSSVTDFIEISGRGLSAKNEDGEMILGGNIEFVSAEVSIPKETRKIAQEMAGDGKTPLFFTVGEKFAGIICVADVVREDSLISVSEMKKMGLDIVMLTGDNERTAHAVASSVGIDNVVAGVLPDGKANEVSCLSKNTKVAMVGDGINDAPALKSADLGIAIGAGTDIAIDAADVVLVNSKLSDVVSAIKLGRSTLRNIRQNLFWAFFYNIVGIPIAAGVLFVPFGIQLSPMIAAAAMSISSVCVVTNALRLNFIKLHTEESQNSIIREKEKIMKRKITLKIEGMMCIHCESRVKSAIESVAGVESATVSHENGSAVVYTDETVSADEIKKSVENAGYTVASIE